RDSEPGLETDRTEPCVRRSAARHVLREVMNQSVESRARGRPLGPRLFPYTTLFRAVQGICAPAFARVRREFELLLQQLEFTPHRSEEHTSELQSRENLVCRLLLEKKKSGLSGARERR